MPAHRLAGGGVRPPPRTASTISPRLPSVSSGVVVLASPIRRWRTAISAPYDRHDQRVLGRLGERAAVELERSSSKAQARVARPPDLALERLQAGERLRGAGGRRTVSAQRSSWARRTSRNWGGFSVSTTSERLMSSIAGLRLEALEAEVRRRGSRRRRPLLDDEDLRGAELLEAGAHRRPADAEELGELLLGLEPVAGPQATLP